MKQRLLILLVWALSTAMVVPRHPSSTDIALIPRTGVAAQPYRPPEASHLPDLATFISQVQNGQADQIVGLYLPELAALPVLSQPVGDPFFVADQPQTVTLFSSSLSSGSIGLLAHSHLAGRFFSQVGWQQPILLIYGDGRKATYLFDHLESYQALQPNDPYSEFASLADGSLWDNQSLFNHMYASGPNLVLQTCLEMDGLSTWGRLFVIATPSSNQFWKGLTNLGIETTVPLAGKSG